MVIFFDKTLPDIMVQKIKKEYDSYLEMVRKKLDKLQNNPTYGAQECR